MKVYNIRLDCYRNFGTEEEYSRYVTKLQRHFPDIELAKPDIGEYSSFISYSDTDKKVTASELLAMVEDMIEHKVISVESYADDIAQLAEKQTVPPNSTYNNRVDVHMPGQALSVYNNVHLLEDGCTDALQELLDGGWRIIAACPQPDQRRPDYILGRFS